MRFFPYFLGFCLLMIAGCATQKNANEVLFERQSQNRPNRAVYGTEGFYQEDGFPTSSKKKNDQDFFFKHCDLEGRNPFPSVSEWECSELR